MTNEAVKDTPAEATGATDADAANLLAEAKGTPADDATVQAGDNGAKAADNADKTPEDDAPPAGEQADEPKHSDARLTAERESAHDEGYTKARTELAQTIKERDASFLQLATVAAEEKGLPSAKPALIRAVMAEAKKLEPKFDADGDFIGFTDQDVDPIAKVVGQVWDVMQPTAMALANKIYTDAINRLFDEKERDALWEESASAGLTNVDQVLKLAIEKKALGAAAIKSADAETVEKVNANVKKARIEWGDKRYIEGRDQGKKDRVGDRSTGTETAVSSDSKGMTVEEAQTLPVNKEFIARRMARLAR